MRSSVSRVLARTASVVVLGLATAVVAAYGQEIRPSEMPSGPVPITSALPVAPGASVFTPSADAPAAAPNHPPIHLIPPMPMAVPVPGEPASLGPDDGRIVVYDAERATTTVGPPRSFAAGLATAIMGGGYSGPDGGGAEIFPATMGTMSLIGTAQRADHPWRMNAKLVMRWGGSYFVCSGTMQDAEVVLTAGHCVFNGTAWADEIWVYPGWDGNGSIVPTPPSTSNPFGWGRATYYASPTAWISGGDYNYDMAWIAITRGVGMLTGWFGWAYGGTCAFWTTTSINNASYPAEGCGTPGLHNGRDMYYWFGNFDACYDTNQLQLNTTGGCYNAIWGGQSGSGAYYIDADARYVHGITSRSDRATVGLYARLADFFVTYLNNTFVPDTRGASFDLQPLDVTVTPTSIPSGDTTTQFVHLAANPSNGAANKSFFFDVYLSSNDNIDTTDTYLGTQVYNWNFAPMGAVTVNGVQLTIPANTPAGNYWIGLIYQAGTDADAGNDDTDGWDASPITITNRDLDITALSAPALAQPGEVINVNNTVQNIGNATSAAARLGLYLSADITCTTGDTLLNTRNIPSLGPGGSSNVITPVTIPPGTPLATRYICGIADDLFGIPEVNENNNTAYSQVLIAQPDLVVSALTVPALVSPGMTVNVNNTVANNGGATAAASTLGLYLSMDTTCTTGDTFLGSRGVGSLGPSISSSATTPVTIPAGTPFSTRYICAIADSTGVVTESNEGNNTAYRTVDIVSATPIVTLKVNGQHPAPPIVYSTGPLHVTVDVSPSTWSTPLAYYWALVLNGQLYWVTPSGVSTIPTPLFTAVPSPLNNVTLMNVTLPPGTVVVNAWFLVSGSTTVASDFIVGVVQTTSAPPQ